MKKILYTLIVAALALSCASEQQKYVNFLEDNMSLADKVSYGEDYWQANVAKTLEVRDKMGWNIPEREFKHFVLPLRVNNETLDDFRTIYADELCERVKGLPMYDAVLEINYWCHEMATYQPSDARTKSPLATIRYGFGRCGEESVLGVAALRAAGIPARQVYTPRWAHTDDNHAWIEAWVDGKWYFLGACEPEAKLNMGWFSAPVSRALILHTKVFGGEYDGPEDVISKTSAYTEINVTSNYVPVRDSYVTVCDEEGKPVEGATVEYRIYNYGEFYPVAQYSSDADGKVRLQTGCGELIAWAAKGDKFGIGKVSGENSTVVLDHTFGDVFSIDFDLIPPPEDPIPSDATEEEMAQCKARMEKGNAIREARPKGNAAVTDGFRADNAGNPNVEPLLKSLSRKDWNDVTREVLDDALAHCDAQSGATFDPWRDAPRIEGEFLYPYFGEIASSGLRFAGPSEIADWVGSNIAVDDAANPQKLRIAPIYVWRSRTADTPSRNIFFVAMCRAFGFQARIDLVTDKVQYMADGGWADVDFEGTAAGGFAAPQGSVSLHWNKNAAVKDPSYYRHFTLARIYDGTPHLLSFDEEAEVDASKLFSLSAKIDEGYYSLTSGARQADGSVLAHVEFFNVAEGAVTDVPLIVREKAGAITVIGNFDAEPYIPQTGRGYFIMAIMGDKDEPTNHAVRQFTALSDKLAAWGRPVLFFGKTRPEGLPTAIGQDSDGSAERGALCSACKVPVRALPCIAVCDTFGRIVYLSQGYNTSLVEDLTRVIDNL